EQSMHADRLDYRLHSIVYLPWLVRGSRDIADANIPNHRGSRSLLRPYLWALSSVPLPLHALRHRLARADVHLLPLAVEVEAERQPLPVRRQPRADAVLAVLELQAGEPEHHRLPQAARRRRVDTVVHVAAHVAQVGPRGAHEVPV